MGYGGPLTHTEITLSSASTWEPKDVTSFGADADAVGVILQINRVASGDPSVIGARPNGGTETTHILDDYGTFQLFVKVGTSNSIELYSGDLTNNHIYLVWQFKDEAHFLSTPQSMTTPSVNATWTASDISTHVQAGDTAVAALIQMTTTAEREQFNAGHGGDGATYPFSPMSYLIGAMVPVNSSNEIRLLAGDTVAVSATLVGYIKDFSGWTFYSDPTGFDHLDGQDDGNYHDLPQQSGKEAGLIMLGQKSSSTSVMDASLRKKGASEEYDGRPGARGYSWSVIEYDSNGYAEIQQPIGDFSDGVTYVYGTWIKPPDALFDGTIDQSTGPFLHYKLITTVAPTQNTLTVTIDDSQDGVNKALIENIGLSLVREGPDAPDTFTHEILV